LDPASLVVAALIYVAVATGQKITEQFGTATAQRLQRLVEAVYTKVRGTPEAETVVRDWEQNPTDAQRQAALARLIRQLIREDQQFARQVEQLQNELRTRIEEQRREFGALEARVLGPAVAPAPPLRVGSSDGAGPDLVPAPDSSAGPAALGVGIEVVCQRLAVIIETQLPAGHADAVMVMLEDAKVDLLDALNGSGAVDEVEALAQHAVDSSNTTREAIAAVRARVEKWIEQQRSG
jgi:hypothetical protein